MTEKTQLLLAGGKELNLGGLLKIQGIQEPTSTRRMLCYNIYNIYEKR